MTFITALVVVLLAAGPPAVSPAQAPSNDVTQHESGAHQGHAGQAVQTPPAPPAADDHPQHQHPAPSAAAQDPATQKPATQNDHSHHPPPAPPAAAQVPAMPDDHSQHRHPPPSSPLPPHIPPLTDADRAAAFPDVDGHTVHDQAIHYFVLFDRLEWQGTRAVSDLSWNNKGWIGRDVDRFWFRTEGHGEHGRLEAGQVHALYGRAIARWWDAVAGIRQDVRPGPARAWAAIGIQGLAPYWFEVEATAYIGGAGRTHFRVETEYELLLTNRLILQPLAELEIYGQSDPERGIGSGLSSADVGLRLRYEIRREFAPYVGILWNRKFFGTADHARDAGDRTAGTRLAIGLRMWL